MLNDLLARKAARSKQRHAEEPDYFTRLARAYAVDLGREPDLEARRDRLAEWNVVEGVRRVCETPILQKAWACGAIVRVHGLIYGLKDGRLRDLDCSIGPRHFQTAHFTQEAAQ
jgi:carbonic anhydrase